MAFPFYRGLAQRYPQSRITLLGPAFIQRLPDGVHFTPLAMNPSVRRSFRGLISLAQALKTDTFDLAVGLPASLSSALLFWLADIPCRVGFAEIAAVPFLTHSIRWKGRAAGRHKSELYLDLVRELGGSGVLAPVSSLSRFGEKNRLIVAPGASIALREWPYFVELLTWLRNRFPSCQLTVVGAQGESGWHQKIARMGDPGVEDLIERTSLEELIDLFYDARLVISNDSGPAHVAATVVGAPTLVLFGPGDPDYIAPVGKNVFRVRRKDLACSPCESAICRAVEKKACLNGLSLELVKDAIERVMNLSLSLTP